jgi:hypothetical protein
MTAPNLGSALDAHGVMLGRSHPEVVVVTVWTRFVFEGGGVLDGPRWCHLLDDGSAPSYHRLLLSGSPLHRSWQTDSEPREWDLYLRAERNTAGRPTYRYAGREATGDSSICHLDLCGRRSSA